MNRVLFIINPAGNGGAGLRVWEAFKTAWAGPIDSEHVVFTERSGHAREIAASSTGFDILVAVGGDGTVGEVISGIMEQEDPRPKLAIIPCGTGNDVARAAGIFSVSDAATALQKKKARPFDLIQVERQHERRYAFLFANAGFSAIPMMEPWMKRMLGATGAYYLSTLLQGLVYKPPEMTVSVDGKEYAGKLFLVMAGNAEYAGGGSMRIAPGALTDDGKLNISIIRSVPKMKLISQLFSSIANGTHINEPEVDYFMGKKITVTSEPPVPLDLDGELFGTTPATISVCPKALHIICSVSDADQP